MRRCYNKNFPVASPVSPEIVNFVSSRADGGGSAISDVRDRWGSGHPACWQTGISESDSVIWEAAN